MSQEKTSPKKRSLLAIIAIVLVALVTVGGAAAYFILQSQPVTNTFQGGTTGCRITETVTGNEKKSILLTNDGSFPVYVRVRLVTYWQTPAGTPAAKAAPALQLTTAAGWVRYGDCYYYETPVQGGASVELLAEDLPMTTDADGNKQVIEVLAETVQSSPSDAVADSWGRTVNASGRITG